MNTHRFAKHNMENYVENILAENLTLKRQLESKSEALVILNKELEECKNEKDQFKLMAEKLQEKCAVLKGSSLKGDNIFNDRCDEPFIPSGVDSKEINRSLKFEVECLRQKLRDALGDVKALRTKLNEQKSVAKENSLLSIKNIDKEEELVKQLEKLSKAKRQLEIDLQSIFDEKEELIIERDAYKCKVHRLNHEFNVLLKGDNRSIIDIDSLIMENRFLQEQLQQAQAEINLSNQTVNRYKDLMDKKHNKGAIKFGLESLSGTELSEKQVQELLDNSYSDQSNPAAAVNDLRSICYILMENFNDKSLALSHQKKANRILAAQICQLEQKLESMKGSQFILFPSKVLLEGYSGQEIQNGNYNKEKSNERLKEEVKENDAVEEDQKFGK